MTESNNNNQNDQPTEQQQPSDETQTEYREISEEELMQILRDHRKWVESDGKEGARADLKKAYLYTANLQGANLVGANLKKANLNLTNLKNSIINSACLEKTRLCDANLYNALLDKANLQKADLGQANLQYASLYKANLHKASLSGTYLKDTSLTRANLEKADLSRANLQKASLKKADMRTTILDSIVGLNEANLQYANLEGATGLLGNEFAQADVTGTKLPDDIKEFKALETVKETSQNARKIFFAMLLGCVYSWLTIATTTDVRLLTNTASSPLPIIGTEIPIAWFYIAAPLVLICLYFYFHLYLDNLWGALAGLPAIFPDGKRLDERAYPWLLNTLVRRHFKRIKSRSLIARMKEWITIFLAWCVVPFTMMAFWVRYIPRHDWLGTCFHIGLIVLSVAFAILFYRLCALSLQGKEKAVFALLTFWKDRRLYYSVIVVVVGILFSLLSSGAINGKMLYENQKINIFNLNKYKMEEIVPKAFSKIGYDVFANFREKEVSEKPNNYWEISENKQLKSVKGANLKNRNLKNADMQEAFLVKADLRWASLNNANLERAELQQAKLQNANLQEARLWKANLQQANLTDANLQEANLWKANLQQANLRGANLQNAELREAKNLAIDQFYGVKTLFKAKLDDDLKEQIESCCRHLLEEPKEEPDKTK